MTAHREQLARPGALLSGCSFSLHVGSLQAASDMQQLKGLEAEPWIQAADLMMVRTAVNRALSQTSVRREGSGNPRWPPSLCGRHHSAH